ncbi:MAG TPA: isoprenylcysteine carboxylmethyltransferase family protein [Neobacillus sp.]|jgi:methyltransferase
MTDIFPFLAFFTFILLQRMVELLIASRNEKWMKKHGAIEFGTRHYHYMVWMHLLFFTSIFCEKYYLNRELSPYWLMLLVLFLGAQVVRIWAISSLGKYWNTKIIVLPNAEVIRRGPYRYIKHPNYFVVSIEFVVIPLMFNAFGSVVLFTFLNVWMLSIRIPEEENALRKLTEYEGAFHNCHRFNPIMLNKCDR